MDIFYLGTHQGAWLEQVQRPLFLSVPTLARYADNSNHHPRGLTPWALDSGGYSEIVRHGHWRTDPDTYGGMVYRIMLNVGAPPDFVSIQDWPCEPAALRSSGMTILEHQHDTIRSLTYLREEFPHAPWIPVLQGWRVEDYVEHCRQYARCGIDLVAEPVVGVGSICRRGLAAEVGAILTVLRGLGLRNLHAFGVKRQVLDCYADQIVSADSMAWSRTARYNNTVLPGCVHHGPCNNCSRYAQRWRRDHLRYTRFPQQSSLELDFTTP